jgi:hypothetical protein
MLIDAHVQPTDGGWHDDPDIPRSVAQGVRFEKAGTLHADRTFEPNGPPIGGAFRHNNPGA